MDSPSLRYRAGSEDYLMKYSMKLTALLWLLVIMLFVPQPVAAVQTENLVGGRDASSLSSQGAGRVPIVLDWGDNHLATAPVTFGIPLPRGLADSTEQLCVVTEEGELIPAQMEVTATWDGPTGSIRWLLLSMNVQKGQSYALEYGREARTDNLPDQQKVRVEDGAEVIAVTTGPMRAEVSKVRPTILDAVFLDVNGDGRFSEDEAIVTPAAAAAHLPVVIDSRGSRYIAGGAEAGLKVEMVRQGPMEVAIRREGWYVAEEDGKRFAQFITYTYFYGEQAAVRHDHTFVVAFDSTKHQVRDIRLSLPLATGAGAQAEFATNTSAGGDVVAVDAGTFPVSLLQKAHNQWELVSPLALANHFQPVGEGVPPAQTIAKGERAGGWFGLADERWGAYAGWRDFWQQYPGELEVENGVLHLHLWSSRGGSVLDFTPSAIMGEQYPGDRIFYEWLYAGGLDSWTQAYGVGKTHNIWFNFFSNKGSFNKGSSEQKEAAAQLTRAWINMPVLASAPPEWNVATEAFGRVHPEDRARFPELEAALDALLQRKLWLRERYEQYGWIDYGDAYYRRNSDQVLWRRWASMFYGWPNVAPLMYLRSGRRDAWDYHRVNTKHIIDIDIGHLDSKEFGKRKGGRYGGDGGIVHYAADQYGLSPDSHIRFMYFDYYINGNLRAWEVADYYAQQQYEQLYPSRAVRQYLGRTSGGTLRFFCEAYEATWKPEYLRAMRDVAETFYQERAEKGFTEYDDVYKNEGKVKYYQLTGDERMLDLFLNDMNVLLDSRDPLSGRLPRPDGRGNTIWGLSQAYFLTGDDKYLDYLYWQVGNALTQMHTALDPNVGPESVGDMRPEFTAPPEQTYHATMGVQFPTAMVVMAEAGVPFPYLLASPDQVITAAEEGDGRDPAIVLYGDEVIIPALGRPLPVYFHVPEDNEGAALFTSAKVRIFDPGGTPLFGGRPVEGWVELPAVGQTPGKGPGSNPAPAPDPDPAPAPDPDPDHGHGSSLGLWRLEAVDLYTEYTLKVRHIPPYFALDEPARYFTPEIKPTR